MVTDLRDLKGDSFTNLNLSPPKIHSLESWKTPVPPSPRETESDRDHDHVPTVKALASSRGLLGMILKGQTPIPPTNPPDGGEDSQLPGYAGHRGWWTRAVVPDLRVLEPEAFATVQAVVLTGEKSNMAQHLLCSAVMSTIASLQIDLKAIQDEVKLNRHHRILITLRLIDFDLDFVRGVQTMFGYVNMVLRRGGF